MTVSKTLTRNAMRVLAVLGCVGGAEMPAAHASLLTTFTLNNVSFDDGSTATGTFVYDASTGSAFSDLDIITSAHGQFGGQYTTNTFRSGVSGAAAFSGFQLDVAIDLGAGLREELLLLVYENFSLTSSNPLVTIPPQGYPYTSYEAIYPAATPCCDIQYRYVVSGSIDPQIVALPEPSSLADMGISLIGLGVIAALRPRRRSSRPV
jgi:hypothetical protein